MQDQHEARLAAHERPSPSTVNHNHYVNYLLFVLAVNYRTILNYKVLLETATEVGILLLATGQWRLPSSILTFKNFWTDWMPFLHRKSLKTSASSKVELLIKSSIWHCICEQLFRKQYLLPTPPLQGWVFAMAERIFEYLNSYWTPNYWKYK